MFRFPLDGLLDKQACYDFLLRILHPEGLHLLAVSALSVLECALDQRRESLTEIAPGL
jgi:hypothetical protein